MPAVIDDQPWPPPLPVGLRRPDGSFVIDPANNQPLQVVHDQIVLWVSLTPRGWASPAGSALFPVVLDTGFNDTLLMRQEQADAWVGAAEVARLPLTNRTLRVGQDFVDGRDADLWLWPNVPGTRDPDPGGMPVRLELPGGAWIAAVGSYVARDKPLIGLRLIRHNGLTVRLDGLARRVSVETP
ncbi:MAG: hypothetical protein K2X82_12675 [Gemmataceae bacterium]|nr:hypothetical protein [Gemmataceae bacterium]